MKNLDAFTAAYLRAMFFTNLPDGEIPPGPFENVYSESEYLPRLCPSDYREALVDCARFQVKVRPLTVDSEDWDDIEEYAGADFWYTRNGHGVGFWSRPEVYGEGRAEALTKLAESFGEVWPDILAEDETAGDVWTDPVTGAPIAPLSL